MFGTIISPQNGNLQLRSVTSMKKKGYIKSYWLQETEKSDNMQEDKIAVSSEQEDLYIVVLQQIDQKESSLMVTEKEIVKEVHIVRIVSNSKQKLS
ncbi:hypothetical protein F8M41_016376 [Gigaspora margarita]|uniref:Uncharacterized protein n=1 Tax=Gigaspora margarita TaxID=4874 RepID=A0A8H4APR9_GIGMA|nr:hypothetical protein F8M41_016376 [Gigaspora margarita]